MKILMTNHRIDRRGGTELFVDEASNQLRKGGHEVCVFSTLQGLSLVERLEAAGAGVVADPADCPFTPDLIHGQHHLETMAALCSWPRTPAIYFAHGYAPWEEQPPVHPRIRKYVTTSPLMAEWLAGVCGVAQESVGTISTFFDPAQFSQCRTPAPELRRALVFHNQMEEDGDAFRAIREACETAGLALDSMGTGFGRIVEEPGKVLPDYDLVFAAGRSAVEAMACGCAVIVVSEHTFAPRVHPENFDLMVNVNFTALPNYAPLEAGLVLDELRELKAPETVAVTERIRVEATLEARVRQLVGEYRAALDDFEEHPEVEPAAEVRALGRYLLSAAEGMKGVDRGRAKLREEAEVDQLRAEKWKRRAEQKDCRLLWLEQKMEKGGWLKGRLWRKLRREWEEQNGR